MSDTNLPQEGTAPKEQIQEPSYSPVEQEAIENGWVPKEQYNGEEHKWVDAAEFLRRGELFKKIENQSRELKDVKRALIEMRKLHASVQEVEYKRALDTLRAQKKEALENGDADAVIAADERIDLVKEQQRQLSAETVEPEQSGAQHPEFVAWTEKNQWYVNSNPMRAFADALGADLARQGLPPSEVLKKVEAEVRKEFPHKFTNPKQARPGAVESPSGRGAGNTKGFTLSQDERRIMQTFVRTGVMTEEEYIRDLKKIKGV